MQLFPSRWLLSHPFMPKSFQIIPEVDSSSQCLVLLLGVRALGVESGPYELRRW